MCLLIGEFVLKPFDFPVKIGRGKKKHLAIHPRHQIQLQWKLFEWNELEPVTMLSEKVLF